MGFSFNRISDFFVVVVIVVIVVQEVLHERGFSELRASRAKNILIVVNSIRLSRRVTDYYLIDKRDGTRRQMATTWGHRLS